MFIRITKADSNCEIIWSKLQFAKGKGFGTFYRPMHNDITIASLNSRNLSVYKLGKNIDKNNVILAGDLNQPRTLFGIKTQFLESGLLLRQQRSFLK